MKAGPGSFARMKAHMNSHVLHTRLTMFRESADNVQSRLEDMGEKMEGLMGDKTDEVFAQMKRDYRSVIGGGDLPQDGQILPKDQRIVRKEVMKILDEVEKSFLRVSGKGVEDDVKGNKENEYSIRDASAEVHDEEVASVAKGQEQDTKAARVKREPTPSDQLTAEGDGEPPKSDVSRSASSASSASRNEPMPDSASEHGSEAKLQSQTDSASLGSSASASDSESD